MTTTTRIAAIIEHTPGPWAIRHTPRCHSALPFLEILSGTTVIGELFNDQTNYDNEPTGGEGEANARLIAAAPDLLDQVEYLATLLTRAVGNITALLVMSDKEDKIQHHTAEYVAAINAADAAITKARGPQ